MGAILAIIKSVCVYPPCFLPSLLNSVENIMGYGAACRSHLGVDQVVGQHEIDVGVNVRIRPKVLVVAAGVALADSSATAWLVSVLRACALTQDGGDKIKPMH